MEKIIIILLITAYCCSGVVQKIEIFSDWAQKGESVILREKIPNLYNWRPLLANAKSYCVIGQWLFFDEINYEGNWVSLSGTGTNEIGYEEIQCKNRTFGSFHSAKFRGESETRTPTLEFTEGTHFGCFGGQEAVVVNTTPSFKLDSAECVRANGKMDWTLFSEENYEGHAQCLKSNGDEVQYVGMAETGPVRSARKGCDIKMLT